MSKTTLLAWATLGAAFGFGACNPSTVFFDPTGKTCTAGGTDCPTGWSCVLSTSGAEYVCWPTADAGEGEPDSGLVLGTDGGRDAGQVAGRDAGPDAGTAPDGGHDGGADAGDGGERDGGGGDGGHCTIEGETVSGGAVNSANACQSCQPSDTTTTWSNLADGTACARSEVCAGGVCSSNCYIDGGIVAASTVNTANACQSCQPGNSTTAWSNVADGTACGSSQLCSGGVCSEVCIIGGSILATNAVNLANPCQSCQPGTSTTSWSNLADGTGCGGSEVCSSGVCSNACYIGAAIVDANSINPANDCQDCNTSKSSTSWTSLPDGTACGSGMLCASGVCSPSCDIGGSIVSAAATNPSDACQDCDPSQSTSSWTTLGDGAACDAGMICASGTCSTDCDIGGTIVAAATVNTANTCQSCQPGSSTTDWTNLPDGTGCATSELCASGVCGSVCDIDGGVFPATTVNPNDACQACVPAQSTSSWTVLGNGVSCGSGVICASGACAADCDIGGNVVTANTVNPTNSCQLCVPASSTTAWSNEPDGFSCSAGGVCASGTCSADCDIGGKIITANVVNPANACQECEPSQSTAAWTTLGNGAVCDAGMICASGTCAADCFIDGGIVSAAMVDSANSCLLCAPTASTNSWSNEPNGFGCGTGLICASGACTAACDIGGNIVAANAINPVDTCEECEPSQSTTGWTVLGNGASCGTGMICASGTCSADCDINGPIVTANTVDSTNPCLLCIPSSSTSAWSNEPNGKSCGTGEVCSSGTCISGCGINGTAVAAGSSPASNPCVSCQPDTSTTSYTNVTNGTACGTGLSCVAGSCCGGTVGTLACGANQVDTCLDDLNCGSCGAACTQPNGCFAGVCQLPATMPVALDSLAAATGPDGRIYAIGGYSSASNLTVKTVNAFNPRTNLWASETALPTAVMSMGAAADSTGIFAMGGYSCTTTTECTNATGTTENFGQFLTISTGVWTKTSNAPVEFSDNVPAVGPGGVFFMPGGFGGSLTQTLRFTPSGVGAGGTWTNTGPGLIVGADYLADTAGTDGTIYAIGGTSTYMSALADVQTLKSGAASWALVANLPTPRCDLAAATDSTGLIYAIGGDDCAFEGGTYTLYDTNEIFNPTLGTWSEGPALPNTITSPGYTVGPEGRIYVLGGWDGSTDQAYVQVYDPVSGYWIP